MSQVLLNQYLAQFNVLKKVGGTHRESIVSEAFKNLLKSCGQQHDLIFTPEYKLDSATKDTETVFELLMRVTAVSLETVRIVGAMKGVVP